MLRFIIRTTGLVLLTALLIGGYLVYQGFERYRQMSDVVVMGDVAAMNGDYSQALGHYRAALAVQPTNLIKRKINQVQQKKAALENRLKAGNRLYRLGDDQAAMTQLADLKDHNPRARQIYHAALSRYHQQLAEKAFEEGQIALDSLAYDSALTHFRHTVRYDPNHPEAWQRIRQCMQHLMLARMETDLSQSYRKIEVPASAPWEREELDAEPQPGFRVIDQKIIDTAKKTQISLFVVSTAPKRSQLRTIVNSLFLQNAYKVGFRYRDQATHIEIFVYPSQDVYFNDSAGWTAHLSWARETDGSKPRIEFQGVE